MENHKGETLVKVVEICLLDWRIDKILAFIVDNATFNSGSIYFIQKNTKHRKTTILEHKFLHLRCTTYILNLIVYKGLT